MHAQIKAKKGTVTIKTISSPKTNIGKIEIINRQITMGAEVQPKQ